MSFLSGAIGGFSKNYKKKKKPQMPDRAIQDDMAVSMKKGGRVKKTGIFKLHKGEKVIPAKRVKRSGKRR